MLLDGASYHVTARTNNAEMLFASSEAKRLFLRVLRQAKKKFNFQLCNFSVMNNHIHLLITPVASISLSKIMQWIMSVFAMRYNAKFSRCGHFWRDRFFSAIIHSLIHFLRVTQYIDNNPYVAGLVSDPVDWQFGGYYFRIKKITSQLLDDPCVVGRYYT